MHLCQLYLWSTLELNYVGKGVEIQCALPVILLSLVAVPSSPSMEHHLFLSQIHHIHTFKSLPAPPPCRLTSGFVLPQSTLLLCGSLCWHFASAPFTQDWAVSQHELSLEWLMCFVTPCCYIAHKTRQ